MLFCFISLATVVAVETQGGAQSGIVEMPIPKSMALQLGLLLEVMKKNGDSHTSLCMFFTLQDCWHILELCSS